jgi:hypothetical protein
MANAKKKLDIPDIGGLLGQINEKRDAHPKSPIQTIEPVSEKPVENKPAKTPKQENAETGRRQDDGRRSIGGRKSIKKMDIEYVKISPKVPKSVKKRVDIALIEERFRDSDGNLIKTLDEITSLAFERLLK